MPRLGWRKPRERRAAVHAWIVAEVLWERLPPRRLRSNPRVVKRKMSNFPRKRSPHRSWPQPTQEPADAVRMRGSK